MATDPCALQFNGSTQLAKLDTRASIKGLSSFTCMAWFKAGSGANNPLRRMWVERQGVLASSKIRFSMTPYRGKLRFEFGPQDSTGDVNYDIALPNWNDDYWHHGSFTASLSGGNPTYKITLDGVKVAEGKLSLPAGVTAVANTTPIGVYLGCASLHTSGGEVFLADRFWQGKLDDILIFNTAQSEADILTYVQSHEHWPGSDVDIFSNWRFTENTGSSTTDADNPTWTGTLYTHSGGVLTASSTLWVKDRPFLGGGTADTTAPTAPTTPTTDNITSDATRFNWVGNRINDDNIYIHHYQVQASLTNTFSSTVADVTTQNLNYTFTGLLPNTGYWYRVRGVDQAGNNSSWLTMGSATTTSTLDDVTPPAAPTNVTASSVTYNSFQLNWTASVSGDKAGYKLDVSTSPTFASYVDNYQNRDIGNVTTFLVSPAVPLTTYYARLRTYDTSDNESDNSTIFIVQTAPLPDVAPPTKVVIQEATSIASRAFTLNWLAASDDVGVVSYEIDVYNDAGFTSPLVTAITYTAYNVGNVLSYRVLDAVPDEDYYVRVRARDASGKVSPDSDVYVVRTPPLSIEDGGFLTAQIVPSGLYSVNSTTPGSKFATPLVISGNGSAATSEVYFRLDPTTLPGTINSVSMEFDATGSIGTGFTVTYASTPNTVYDLETITWTTKPTVITNSTTEDMFAHVIKDITVLFSTKATSLIKLTATESGSVTISNLVINFEVDPITATQPSNISVSNISGEITNWITNPSFEVGTTTTYSPNNNGSTVLAITTDAYSGTKAMQVTGNATQADMGFMLSSGQPAAAVGQTWTFSVALKQISGHRTFRVYIEEQSGAGATLASSYSVVTITNTYGRYSHTRTLTNASTAKLMVKVYVDSTVAFVLAADCLMLEQRNAVSAYIDGSSPGAYWTGTTNASVSKRQAAAVTAVSSYLGDSNTNNSVAFLLQPQLRANSFSTLPWNTPTVNRSTKQWTSTVGPSFGAFNLVINPSFETNTTGWTVNGTGSIARDATLATRGGASLAVTVPATSQYGALSPNFPVKASTTYAYSCRVLAPIGMYVALRLQTWTSADALATSAGITTSTIIGDGTWQTISGIATTGSTSSYGRLRVEVTTPAVAGTFWVDEVICTQSTDPTLYFDGDMPGGSWDGIPHASSTSVIVLPQSSYDLSFRYADADGFIDNTGLTTFIHGTTYVTAAVPDNATTLGDITYNRTTTSITASISYTGDDDDDMTATATYVRADLSQYEDASVVIDRATQMIYVAVDALRPGTAYTLKIQVTDNDGVYNPVGGLIQQTIATLTLNGVEEGTASIRFNGFDLMGGAGGYIGVIKHDSFGFPDRRTQIEDQPRRHGAIKISDYWGRKTIQMSGYVSGETRGELDVNLSQLKSALATAGLLTLDTLSNHGRVYSATCTRFEITEEGGSNYRHLLWDAEFTCADPFAYDRIPVSITSLAVTNNQHLSYVNEGQVDTDLKLTITTKHPRQVYLTIYNYSTGEMIQPTLGIKSGDVMIIDTSTFSLSKNGVESTFTGQFLHLAPNSNDIVVTFTSDYNTTIPTVDVIAVWQGRYI